MSEVAGVVKIPESFPNGYDNNDSDPVGVTFLEKVDRCLLADKVMLGYVRYPVRAFVPNPLRCFRCHAYGHVIAVCRRDIPRCEECAGGHGTEECVVWVNKLFVSTVGVPILLGKCEMGRLRWPVPEKYRCRMLRQ
jgi:hypothetical protein